VSLARKRITVVAPAYNKAEGIAHFVESLLAVLDTLPDALHAANPGRIGVLHLSRNFGHQAALTEPNASDSFSASKILWPVRFDAGILSTGIPPRKASCNGCPG
jgi:hypothetical protein